MTEGEDVKRLGIIGQARAAQLAKNLRCSVMLKLLDPDVRAALNRVSRAGFRKGMSLGVSLGMILGGLIVIASYHTYFLLTR